jgi:hypothetical protein
LTVIKDLVIRFNKDSHEASVALIGGYAAVYFGSERTTFDIDICFHSKDINPGRTFNDFLDQELPPNFKHQFFEASKDPTDPLKHDLITISDSKNNYPRIDILVIRYKWELEGLELAVIPKKLLFPVIPAPYLIAMKLMAGGRKDDLDIIGLLRNLSEEELQKAKELAKKVRKDKNFQILIKEALEE